jgi:hypothetical protein
MRLIVVGLAAAAALVVASSASALSGYCSPTGDYCTSAARQGGAVFLQLRTFSFRGKVRICVTNPASRRVCHSFALRPKRGGVYEAKVRWYRHYPNAGPGRYRVAFFTGRTRLGPVLDFRVG